MNKLTPLRRELIRVLQTASRPLKVSEVRARMGISANVSTVYRALSDLEKRGTVCSYAIKDTSRWYSIAGRHMHVLICTECHEMRTFAECGISIIQKRVERRFGYDISEHVLYFLGLCRTCARYVKKKSENVNDT